MVVAAGAPVSHDAAGSTSVPAVLYAWYGGQEAGHAVGDLLFGRAVPSGKLPVTFPRRIEDSTAYGHYPGVICTSSTPRASSSATAASTSEQGRAALPLRPRAVLHDLRLRRSPGRRPSVKAGDTLEVSLSVRNTGSRAGAEVVQLYVRDVESSLDRPQKELKGFRRVDLEPGEAQR